MRDSFLRLRLDGQLVLDAIRSRGDRAARRGARAVPQPSLQPVTTIGLRAPRIGWLRPGLVLGRSRQPGDVAQRRRWTWWPGTPEPRTAPGVPVHRQWPAIRPGDAADSSRHCAHDHRVRPCASRLDRHRAPGDDADQRTLTDKPDDAGTTRAQRTQATRIGCARWVSSQARWVVTPRLEKGLGLPANRG